jgi:hypothetical protein
VVLPGCSGELISKLNSKFYISKAGTLILKMSHRSEWADRVLDNYVMFSRYFEERFDYRLFLAAGTLLGLEREGDFIDRDNDVDTAYVSRETTPEAVKEEKAGILRRMAEDGFQYKIVPSGGFFKVCQRSHQFDVFTGWFADGKLWMGMGTCIDGNRELIEPVRETTFRGRRVYVPNMSRRLLELRYGPGWSVPDPGYRHNYPIEAVPTLRRAHFDPIEAEALRELLADSS